MVLKVTQKLESSVVASTPPSITGVVNTKPPTGDVLIDYLSATFPHNGETRRRLRDTFNPEKPVKTTVYGYEYRATVLESGSLLWSQSRPEMGIHLTLPASALAKWGRPIDWLLEMVESNGGKLTRLDLAMDDKKGLLSLQTMLDKLESGEVVTRFKSHTPHYEKRLIGTGAARLTGIEIGTRQSESYVRIYDKRIERERAGESELPENWIRVELELKGDRAIAVGSRLVNSIRCGDGGRFVSSLIYGLIDFKRPTDGDTNKSRWDTAEFWSAFLGECAKESLSLPKSNRSIDQVCDWFEESIAPMAAVILLSENPTGLSGYDWLMEVIAKGEMRWKQKHLNLMIESKQKVRYG